MSKLSISNIQNIAKLARIELDAKEAESMGLEASSILEFVEIIQSTDTSGEIPTSQVTGLTDVWREDVVRPCTIAPKELLANAPELQDGYVKVKKVL